MRAAAIFFCRCYSIGALSFLVTVASSTLNAAIVVRPEQAVYYVTPGETFQLNIHIDGDDQTLGNAFEPLPQGLFSYGVSVTYPTGLATVPSGDQITPVAPLNYFGLAPNALKEVTSTSTMIKGNIDVFAGVYHTDSLLVTIQVTNLAPVSSSYWLDLDEWRTLGANEQIFINGAGVALDTTPSTDLFSPALVIVVPEPSSLWMLNVAALGAGGARRRHRAGFGD